VNPNGDGGARHHSVRIRLDLAYDGGGFAGWARQSGPERTVQGVLEAVLATAAGRGEDPAPRLVVAGRTDAGVHATGQVAHVDLTPAQFAAITRRRAGEGDAASIAHRLTGMLGSQGGDVVVRASTIAPPGFDARFSAVHRRYRYRIADRLAARDPLERHRTHLHATPLDEARMRAAAARLTGLHDFAAYCRPRPGATTIRTLQAFGWERDAQGVLVAEVQADAFCHSMVRALVGASIAVGAGRLGVDRPEALLAAATRSGEFATAPAKGLTLVAVGYPPDEQLAAQAERARARREAAESSGTAGGEYA
jgi:tRNA pseudouridine38-40 synthase